MEEIVAGGLAGIAQTVVGYPLDTVKICIIEKHPIVFRNLYQGCLSPLVGALLVNAQTFYTYEYFKKRYNTFTSGVLTGLGISLIETPTELVKIRMQLAQNPTYGQTIKEIGISRLYHGFTSTCSRNGLALGLYFVSYDFTKKRIQNEYLASLAGGAVAGFTCWAPIYPIDCMKSRIQADTSYKTNLRSFIKNKDMRANLWRGFTPCIIRSIIVNPFIFFTYEISKKYLAFSSE